MSLNKIKSDRLKKLKNLKAQGINPYPSDGSRGRILIVEALENFGDWSRQEKEIILVGRLRLLRGHGGSTFANLQDASDQIQIYFKKDEVGDVEYKNFIDNFDIGDFVEVAGKLFETHKGEKTLLVKKLKILAKALNQLPDKWHGLTDIEERFRRRYLDLLMNEEVRERFRTRSKIVKNTRTFLESNGFMEVDTPILQVLPGGALAKPFKTHLNALDTDLYLRIAPELYLKRLLVGGFEKVYELGRAFRNEGMDKLHNPDFTILEFYWAYANYEQLMELTEELFEFLVPEMEIEYQGQNINFEPPFKRISMGELIRSNYLIDIEKTSVSQLEDILKKLGEKNKPDLPKYKLVDELFKTTRSKIIQPTFVTNHPIEMSPLAKASSEDPREAARFQLVVGGMELINAYSELNDPQEQAARMREQEKHRDEEIQRFDEDYIEALEYGMPPAVGWGLGIERLVMLLTNVSNVREIILFPTMKEKKEHKVEITERIVLAESTKIEATPDLGMDKKKADELVKKYIKDPVTKMHSLESEAIMRALARRFNQDEEKWGIIGLLHDLDWDLTKDNTKEHCLKVVEILKEAGASDFLIDAIQSHGYGFIENELANKQRKTLVEHCLAAAETLSGLIVAAALILPDKKLKSLTSESLKRKFKDKRFAARCDRNIILECEKTGLSLDEFLEIGLKALQGIADGIGM